MRHLEERKEKGKGTKLRKSKFILASKDANTTAQTLQLYGGIQIMGRFLPARLSKFFNHVHDTTDCNLTP